jgi:hypothetical protein
MHTARSSDRDHSIDTNKSRTSDKEPLQPRDRSGIVLVLELALVLGSLFLRVSKEARVNLQRGHPLDTF